MKKGKILLKYKENNEIKEIRQILKKRSYEMIILIHPNTTQKEKDEIIEKYSNLILEEGEIVSKNIWGDRELAYPIKKLNSAYYVVFNFLDYPTNIEKIQQTLKNDEKIIRFLLTRLDDRED
ncbi:MAG: 30S ribosomal protein S6 [Candidatus Calescibacterium sp.]|nr:30S ribosomal protein S6 [Candidatus Calescibacterium sp.]MDW8133211.1 30S ribosomal protein S6 [Candidatus Calescibacterium sp.]